VKVLSLEPRLGPLPNLDLSGIHWVIVKGESVPSARAMREEWVSDMHSLCARAAVLFFFKHWGVVNRNAVGRMLRGWTYDEKHSILTLTAEPRLRVLA
jgi:protein gp37